MAPGAEGGVGLGQVQLCGLQHPQCQDAGDDDEDHGLDEDGLSSRGAGEAR